MTKYRITTNSNGKLTEWLISVDVSDTAHFEIGTRSFYVLNKCNRIIKFLSDVNCVRNVDKTGMVKHS